MPGNHNSGGRNAKPADVHKALGSYRSDRHGDLRDEPPTVGQLGKPDSMTADAEQCWAMIFEQLQANGCGDADGLLAIRLCNWWAIAAMSQRRVDSGDYTAHDLATLNTATKHIEKLASMLGLRHNALDEKLHNRRTVKAEELEQLNALAEDQQSCEDAARDAARFIASLTAVDGAVVLTDTLRIIGFGAEVTASFSGGDKVYVAHTAEASATKAVRFAEYGTRHRSAFRFVASMEPSVGFIMSQDGGVKAVRQVGSKLVMWPYFQIGFTTALS